ncbi:uncharacterized protein LOC111299250 isoform X2 [Durio zibethinus]|uniref:Uncharacterized protein LOC111299250 isoform X2 n=1 Tax=Durio zibethinus TaxID=66656 RepID=A0A6P5ZC80_DURZI|nr:uncharacterized protein LOC111299250 isoform X2 [Durio zibethinus]
MGDPYYRYPASAAAADRGSIPRPSFPGYLSSEAPSLASHHADMQVSSSDVQKRDINQFQPGFYGVNNISNSGVYPDPNLGGLSAAATIRAYPSSLGNPSLGAQRWDTPVGVSSSVVVHCEPSFGGVSAGASIMGYSSPLEVPNLVGHRWDAPGISPSAGVHPEPSLGAVSAAATIRGYSSPLEIPNLVSQRQDASVGISLSAPAPSLGAISAEASTKGYPPSSEDPTLVGQRQDGPLGIKPGIHDAVDEKPASTRNSDGPSVAAEESNILFVDGLPTDCTRREVGHLFRPFIGYKDIKVIHKEPRHVTNLMTRNLTPGP